MAQVRGSRADLGDACLPTLSSLYSPASDCWTRRCTQWVAGICGATVPSTFVSRYHL